MTLIDTTTPFFTQAAATAGLVILSAEQGSDSQGRPTYCYRFGSMTGRKCKRDMPLPEYVGDWIAILA